MSLIGLLGSIPNPLVCDADANTATIYLTLGSDYDFIIDEAVFSVGTCNTAGDIALIGEGDTPTTNIAIEPTTGTYGADTF